MALSDTDRVYDPEQALALAGGRPAIRDQTLAGVLAFLDDPATVHLLCDVAQYRRETPACYERAHRAIGLARQAGLPQLAALLRALSEALDAGEDATAQALGRRLPDAIAAAREAVTAPDGSDQTRV